MACGLAPFRPNALSTLKSLCMLLQSHAHVLGGLFVAGACEQDELVREVEELHAAEALLVAGAEEHLA